MPNPERAYTLRARNPPRCDSTGAGFVLFRLLSWYHGPNGSANPIARSYLS